jgi:hypothetical protein
MPPATSARTDHSSTDELLELFGVCLRAHSLLFLHREDLFALPGIAQLYEDLTDVLDRAVAE